MRRVRPRLWTEDHGAAAVEFALVLPVLFLLLWGIVDIGRAFYTLNNLASAVREGARRAAVMATDPTTGTNPATVRSTVTSAFAPIGGPLAPESVFVAVAGRQVTVSASYPFAPLALLNWTFPVRRSAVFRWEQAP